MEPTPTNYTQIWLQLIGAVVILVPVILNFIQGRRNARNIVAVKADVVEGNAQVVELKKNTDGMQTALLDLNSRANLAEGIKQGSDEERARPPERPEAGLKDA